VSPDRPVFLNLARIRYPVGAVASIGHRLSGVLLILALPFAVWALQHSFEENAVFETGAGWMRLPAALVAWAAAHHLFAGIRHLLTDVGIGSSLPAARASAYAALIAGGAVGLALLLL
jgi:succinate dehydrogenase / fumarate reductase cytochrome b subunit